jgi:hypothetical protein
MRAFFIIVVMLIAGCSQLVCRHQVMSHAVWAEEQGLDYKIVVYETNPLISLGLYNAHVQVRTEKGWINTEMGPTMFFDEPTFPMTGWKAEYDSLTYMKLMRKNCFNWADCRSEGIP